MYSHNNRQKNKDNVIKIFKYMYNFFLMIYVEKCKESYKQKLKPSTNKYIYTGFKV